MWQNGAVVIADDVLVGGVGIVVVEAVAEVGALAMAVVDVVAFVEGVVDVVDVLEGGVGADNYLKSVNIELVPD